LSLEIPGSHDAGDLSENESTSPAHLALTAASPGIRILTPKF